MESKKLAFSDQILPPRRKVVSGFGLGVVASVIVLTIVVLNNNSLKAPIVYSMIQGFNNGSVNSSIVSFSSTTSLSGAANTASVGNVSKSASLIVEQSNLREETHEADFGKNGNFTVSNEDEMIKEKTHFEDYSEMVKNGSFPGKEGRVFGQNLQMNSIQEDNNSKIVPNITSKDQPFEGNSSSVDNISDGAARATESNNGGNIGNSSEETNITADSHIEEMQKSGYKDCDIFDGRWVRDDSKPYYPGGSCPYIDRDFNCHLNGRPDDEFLKWKWQPHGCDIPSLNATDFLERLRGKKLVFVGDSLNRNMWESLVCILRHSIRDKRRVYEISGRREFKKKGLYAFRFEDYNCTVDFVGAPFLVRESTYKGKNGTLETLRLDLMDLTTSTYQDADVIIFNTGHWWTHEKTSRGEDYYQEGNYVHPRLKVLKAYKRALTTWARWVDKNIDGNKTQVFFRGFSVTHFRGGQWNSGGQCDKEVEPIFNNTYLAKYPSKMRALELVLQEISTPVTYLNISRLTDYRKDGHPSTYRMEYKANEEKTAAVHSQDCSHWCLPGVPDTWNELLYVSLLKAGRGSWRS